MSLRLRLIIIGLAGIMPAALCADKFGMYDDSEWRVGISHNTSGYAQGHCSEGFILEISKGGGRIDLDIYLKFIGKESKDIYIGQIRTTLTGTTGGRAVKEHVESPELCFDKKEVVIIKAIGTIDGKRRDLVKEKKLFQSDFIPLPIRLGKDG